jgi:hypothetical protein
LRWRYSGLRDTIQNKEVVYVVYIRFYDDSELSCQISREIYQSLSNDWGQNGGWQTSSLPEFIKFKEIENADQIPTLSRSRLWPDKNQPEGSKKSE